jgi:hypothetical protein
MDKSTKTVLPKKRGRPATGKDPVLSFRISEETTATIERWAATKPDKPPRSEAIRRLLASGLIHDAQVKRIVACLNRGDVDGALRECGINPGKP